MCISSLGFIRFCLGNQGTLQRLLRWHCPWWPPQLECKVPAENSWNAMVTMGMIMCMHISHVFMYIHIICIYIYIIHMYCIYIYDIYIYMYYLHVLYQHWPQQKRKYQASTSCYETLGARNSQKEQPQKARNQGTAQRRERGGRCSKELVGNAAQDTHSKLGDKSDKWEPQRTGHWKTSTRNASTETPAAGHAAQACNCLKVRTPHR